MRTGWSRTAALFPIATLVMTATPGLAQSDAGSFGDEAFSAAQWALTSEAGQAILQLAARFGEQDDALGRLERQRMATREALAVAEDELAGFLGAKDAKPEDISAARDRRAQLAQQLHDFDAAIALADPAYDQMTRPGALAISEVQALLEDDEGLLLLLPDKTGTYAFGVSKTQFAWHRATDLSIEVLAAEVKTLRKQLADTPVKLLSERTAFDRTRAHQLYEKLVRPVESAFTGKRVLMTIPGGELGSLPLAALVTERPSGVDDDMAAVASTAWLMDRYVLTTLPAVSSLKAVRCFLAPAGARHRGCPPGPPRRSSPTLNPGPLVVGFGAPELYNSEQQKELEKLPPYDAVFGQPGRLADTESLRRLGSLDGSKLELDSIRLAFGARAEVHIGPEAREAAIKQSATLSRARFVIFSTHGLLASESNVGEPGLVFTPPSEAQKSEMDDGYLGTSEIAQLRLSADLVVLSACNTAADDGSSASESLSGMARAFLFAGSKALVATHWPVSDDATAELIKLTFSNLDDKSLPGRGWALNSAAVELRSHKKWVEPGYWAPFVLIGTAR